MSDIANNSAAAPAEGSVDTSVDNAQEISAEEPVEGEAAATAAPKKDTKAEKKVVQALKKKLKLKVDGQEYEEEFDPNDDAYLTRQLQLAKAAQKRMSEYSNLEKEVTQFLQDLKKNPRKVLSDPRIGLDVKKLAAEIIEEEIQNAQKSPEQLEKERLESRLRELEDERKKEKEEFSKKEYERLQKNAIEEYDMKMSKALESSDLPKEPYVIKKMADYMILALQNGIDATPEDVLPLVREEIMSDLQQLVKALGEDKVEQFIGKDVLAKIRKKNVAKAKATSPLNKLKDTGAKSKEVEKASDKVSMKDFFGF